MRRAQVQTRLNERGKRVRGKTKPSKPEAMEDQGDDQTLEKLVDEQAKTIAELEEAVNATDQVKKLAESIKARQVMEGRLNDAMTQHAECNQQLQAFGKWFAELRKITGVDSRSGISKWARAKAEMK